MDAEESCISLHSAEGFNTGAIRCGVEMEKQRESMGHFFFSLIDPEHSPGRISVIN